jgi:catechol 2,3-dioxygenase-like lactoylglutathione lyase family enzyme
MPTRPATPTPPAPGPRSATVPPTAVTPLCGAVLYVAEVEAMTRFYAGVFELQARGGGDGWAALVGPGFELVLHAMPPAVAAAERAALAAGPRPPPAREDTPIKLRLPVADLAAARARAAALGGSLLPPQREWVWQGLRVCNGVDPEGNVFQAGLRGSGLDAALAA